MLILVDLDGPLADFEQGFVNTWRATYPQRPWMLPDERRSFRVADEYPDQWRGDIYTLLRSAGFYAGLPIVEGAKAGLEELEAAGHHVYICTSPLSQAPHCPGEKRAWVVKHLGSAWAEKMIVGRDKTLVRAHVLIDDKPDVEGLLTPVWTHVRFATPYNQGRTPRSGWDNMIETVDILRTETH